LYGNNARVLLVKLKSWTGVCYQS